MKNPSVEPSIHLDEKGNEQLKVVVTFPDGQEMCYGFWLEYVDPEKREWMREVAGKCIDAAVVHSYQKGRDAVAHPICDVLGIYQ